MKNVDEEVKKVVDDINSIVFENDNLQRFVTRTPTNENFATLKYLAFTEVSKNETGTQLGLELRQLHEELDEKTFKMTVDVKDAKKLEDMFGINVTLMSYSALLLQARHQIINEFLEIADVLGQKSYEKTLTRIDKIKTFLYKVIGLTYTKKFKCKTAQEIQRLINLKSTHIVLTSRIGKATTCIVGRALGEMIKDDASFIINTDNKPNDSSIQLLGHYSNGVTVYINAADEYNSQKVILFRYANIDQEGVHLAYGKNSSVHQIYEEKTPTMERGLKISHKYLVTKNADLNYTKFFVKI